MHFLLIGIRHFSYQRLYYIKMKFIKEVLLFIIKERKWWLVPLVFVLIIVSLLVVFADSAVAPFIYSLF
ncbi:MAG: DUF5989 family protein [Alistipes putredinis]|uniref:DUF5989 family protein n=1 Tax=Bacteroidales TaxID=171549 RepID=UPI0031BB2496